MDENKKQLELIQSSEDKQIYVGYGYRIIVSITETDDLEERHFEVVPLYEEDIVYMDIRYLGNVKAFVASPPNGFSIRLKDKDMWIKGMENVFRLLTELNERREEFCPDGCVIW